MTCTSPRAGSAPSRAASVRARSRARCSAGAVARRVRPGQLFWMSLLGCGVTLIGFSRTTALVPAIVFAALLGVAVGVLNAALSPIILAETPVAAARPGQRGDQPAAAARVDRVARAGWRPGEHGAARAARGRRGLHLRPVRHRLRDRRAVVRDRRHRVGRSPARGRQVGRSSAGSAGWSREPAAGVTACPSRPGRRSRRPGRRRPGPGGPPTPRRTRPGRRSRRPRRRRRRP